MEINENGFVVHLQCMLCDLGQITCNANRVTLLQLSRHCMYTLRIDQVALSVVEERTPALSENSLF